jgi:hypothetical protein
VKSFYGSPWIKFSSAQLQEMNSIAYFIWLVQKRKADIGTWNIYKINGKEVYHGIRLLAQSKFGLKHDTAGSTGQLSVSINFNLTTRNQAIALKVDDKNPSIDQEIALLGIQNNVSSTVVPKTACEWYARSGISKWFSEAK